MHPFSSTEYDIADRNPGRPSPVEHEVQFYESDDFICNLVSDFILAGLTRSEPLVVITTDAHRLAFSRGLTALGCDVQAACDSRLLNFLDARQTLTKFMRGEMPDWDLFCAWFGSALQTLPHHKHVRGFGEMVDLLWKDRNPRGAIRLEEFWGRITQLHPISVLCAYAMENFRYESAGASFLEVCATHTHVHPTESYSQLGESDSRLREIASLQQRARALEHEIARRKKTEQALLEATRLRDDFLLVAGHELKTPITALRLQMQLLMTTMEEQDPKLQSRFNNAARQVERLKVLAEDVLEVSRVSAGNLLLCLEDFDMADVVRDAVDRFSATAARSQTVLHAVPGETLPGKWDRLRIERMLANLITNALKYGRGGHVEVSAEAAGESIRIIVQDTGIGIDPAHHGRIFDRFERAVSLEHFGGLGLGLWIVKQIVSAHTGVVHVESQLGEGARFIIELPRNTMEAVHAAN